MDVVEEQRAAVAELPPKPALFVEPGRLHEPCRELFRRDETRAQIGVLPTEPGVYSFEQMRLAGADGTMNHERVGAHAGVFDHAQRRSVNHAVTRTHDEIVQRLEPAPGSLRAGLFVVVTARLRGSFRLRGQRVPFAEQVQLRIDFLFVSLRGVDPDDLYVLLLELLLPSAVTRQVPQAISLALPVLPPA